jgi:hypothetical protein
VGQVHKDKGKGGNELPPVDEQRAESNKQRAASTETSLRGAEGSDDPHPCKSSTRFYHVALRYLYQPSEYDPELLAVKG